MNGGNGPATIIPFKNILVLSPPNWELVTLIKGPASNSACVKVNVCLYTYVPTGILKLNTSASALMNPNSPNAGYGGGGFGGTVGPDAYNQCKSGVGSNVSGLLVSKSN